MRRLQAFLTAVVAAAAGVAAWELASTAGADAASAAQGPCEPRATTARLADRPPQPEFPSPP